jgi:hypothetical protein
MLAVLFTDLGHVLNVGYGMDWSYLSACVQRDKLQSWTADLHSADCVRQQFVVDTLQLFEALPVACIGGIVYVRDLLDAGDVLQLQQRRLTLEKVDL